MNRNNAHIVNEYIFVSNKDNFSEEEEKNIAHNFGYIDGYFNEIVYGSLIKYGSSLIPYQIGYKKGENERLSTDENIVSKEKDMWLKRLAAFDGIQNVEARELSKDSLKLYNKYRTMTFNTKVLVFPHNKENIFKNKAK